ncbi:IS110 family transposase [Rathayibacter sp. AY1G1]|uniref:IS110 family transposase n=1 Tax=unclassified Rathayibacter TaxID=2609250 RepID=UPI000CE8E92B|nr:MULTISPECIES: IS110 family transposase [unclassified Rathayibacter]PPH07168.1 IS110 family transposase [Rathayibacter sp. AY1G1]PPH35095.1 IS110 family transposase [Rathayibacter sp. AY1E4]PPH74552.1 IS110 family transposase [Rathayibacter sp. AY1D4]PPH85239.1 IS110 family transposase [Rathayibacter sp. AY1D3]
MIVAHRYDHVVGVDTHARTHTYAIVATKTGEILGTKAFPVTAAAIDRAIAWVRGIAGGSVLFAMEGTGSYGASLGRALLRDEIVFCEVRPPKKSSRVRGKTDEIDAIAAATSAMGIELEALTRPKADGLRNALRVTLDARRDMEVRRTSARNQLNALIRTADFGLDTRRALTDRGVQQLANLDANRSDVAERIIRAEAVRLASTVIDLGRQMRHNREALAELVELLAPGLQQIYGVGPVTAAVAVAAYSHPGRVRSEAAFAALAGVNPIPASSGNTTRHRLNRGGDRQLNRALDVIARVRMVSEARTRAYVDRRTSEGRTVREIRRSVKRYIARELFKALQVRMALCT